VPRCVFCRVNCSQMCTIGLIFNKSLPGIT